MRAIKRLSSAVFILVFSCFLLQEAYAGTWKQGIGKDPAAWWYDNGDGTFPVSTWMWIDGNEDGIAECYYFDDKGRMLSDTVTPDGYMADEYGAWTLGFVRRKYVLNPAQTEIFKDAATGLLALYGDQFHVPSKEFAQIRHTLMYGDRQKLLNALLAADTERYLKNPGDTAMFVPLRTEGGSGYFDRERTLNTFGTVFGVGLNPENIPQSEQGELMGTPVKAGERYRITDCQQDSDGTYLYLKMAYEKINAVTEEVLETGTFYMELYRNDSEDVGFTIDMVSNHEIHG